MPCRTRESLLRQIPQVDRILLDPVVEALAARHGRGTVVAAVRDATETLRARLLAGGGGLDEGDGFMVRVCKDVTRRVEAATRGTLRRAINATGVVLHTGLGRAVLADAAAQAVAAAAAHHSLLEVDAESGERGSRQEHVSGLMRELTGAEGALIVNNNAAAVFLAISALAQGREVVISRGQLVEIGGAFRIPDVIRAAGARLLEVGTTNRTRISDYAAAIRPDTALLLRVHPSNFRIVGFTEEASLDELVALGRERGLPVVDDLGSGALVDLAAHGLKGEPTVQSSVRAGASVIAFSGDKLLGGSQAGLVVGAAEHLGRMKRHPLMRVLRPGKLTLAGITATLRLYRDEARALREIPTLAALTASANEVDARAKRLAAAIGEMGLPLDVELAPGHSQVGGGSLPGEELPTTLVSLHSAELSAGELARRLRTGEPGVWGRVQKNRLLLDMRTVREGELADIASAVREASLGSAVVSTARAVLERP